MLIDTDKYVSKKEYARLIGKSIASVNKYIYSKRLGVVKLQNEVMIKRDEVVKKSGLRVGRPVKVVA